MNTIDYMHILMLNITFIYGDTRNKVHFTMVNMKRKQTLD